MKFLIFIVFFFYSPVSLSERLILSLAEKIFLPLPSNQKIHIGNKSLFTINKEQNLLSLLARKEGQTRLISGKKTYEIFIFNKEKKSQALKLDRLLKQFWGLKWSISDDQSFQVKGTLNRLYDWVKLAKVSQQHNIPYQFKALPSEGLEKQIQHYFKQLFKNKTPAEIVWQKLPIVFVPQTILLTEYEKLLKPFGLIPKEDNLWFSTSPFIEIEIALVESQSSSGFFFGGTNSSDESLLSFSSLLNFLNFLKNSGKGKTLHHSSVITQSGQKVQIQSGGQIPFNSYNIKTEQSSTHWKPYGLTLNITPQLDKKNQIELDIKAKMSEPLSFSSVDSPPPLKTQSLESKVLLKDKQILKLFQLKKQSQGTQNKAQLGFLLSFPSSFLKSKNAYQINQFVFIQVKIKNRKEHTQTNDLKQKVIEWKN